jgi:glycosyltransferase involved in cell wall biosynthesis
VLPSVKEGFGIVFLEAMYYRKPALGPEQAVFPKSFANGDSGVLVDGSELPTRLPEAILRLPRDPRCAEPSELTEEQSSRATFRSPAFATGWNRFSAALATALL